MSDDEFTETVEAMNSPDMKPKYVICPGEVTSKTDGQRHYIGPMQLMRLYGVDPRECEIHEPAPWWPRSYYMAAEERQRGLPRLQPRYDGNYELPQPTVRRAYVTRNYT